MEKNSGILLINKPAGITSFDVIARLRKQLFTRSLGHTGTLDPNATGLLVVLVNKATKILPYISDKTKVYKATLTFGMKTDTGDIWGKPLEEKEVILPEKEELIRIIKSFEGHGKQIPPMVSSIKVKGKKLYEYARDNIEIEREERDIFIDYIHILDINETSVSFETKVSSGTYIRTLCEDIAIKCGNLGTMSSLCRKETGSFSLKDAYNLEDVRFDNVELLDIRSAIDLPYVEYVNISDIFNGKDLMLDSSENMVLVGTNNEALAVYQKRENSYHCVRGLW